MLGRISYSKVDLQLFSFNMFLLSTIALPITRLFTVLEIGLVLSYAT